MPVWIVDWGLSLRGSKVFCLITCIYFFWLNVLWDGKSSTMSVSSASLDLYDFDSSSTWSFFTNLCSIRVCYFTNRDARFSDSNDSFCLSFSPWCFCNFFALLLCRLRAYFLYLLGLFSSFVILYLLLILPITNSYDKSEVRCF